MSDSAPGGGGLVSGGGSHDLVVSYAAIEAAHDVFGRAVGGFDGAFANVTDVGSETLHAAKLDDALDDYAKNLKQVGQELGTQVRSLTNFLATSEQVYRYVDATALTRAVPYNPDHPAPTLRVKTYGGLGFGLQNGPTETGTTAAGTPSDAHGGGKTQSVDPATATARGAAAPASEKHAVNPGIGGNDVLPPFALPGSQP